jgi:hypothetical protein
MLSNTDVYFTMPLNTAAFTGCPDDGGFLFREAATVSNKIKVRVLGECVYARLAAKLNCLRVCAVSADPSGRAV